MTDTANDDKAKGERSPSYPFISLRKAEERAKQFWEKHRKEGARLATVAPTWTYGIKSSGLQQTVGALKQYGLMEDSGSGDERKVMLTELGRKLVADQRDGAVEAARKEAAMRPRLFQEYRRWIAEMPSQSHCLSELELDRGFNPAAAQAFLKAFTETVSFAKLRDGDSLSSSPEGDESDEEREMSPAPQPEPQPLQGAHNNLGLALAGKLDPANLSINASEPAPFAKRLSFQMTVGAISISATLFTPEEVDVVIRYLEANKAMLAATSTH